MTAPIIDREDVEQTNELLKQLYTVTAAISSKFFDLEVGEEWVQNTVDAVFRGDMDPPQVSHEQAG